MMMGEQCLRSERESYAPHNGPLLRLSKSASLLFVVRLSAFLGDARFHCPDFAYLALGKTAVATVFLKSILGEASHQSFDAWQILGDILKELTLDIKPTGRDSVLANAWNIVRIVNSPLYLYAMYYNSCLPATIKTNTIPVPPNHLTTSSHFLPMWYSALYLSAN